MNGELIDVRCRCCGRLLGRATSDSRIEVKCPRCKTLTFRGPCEDKLARPDKIKEAHEARR
jgi:phage FluMu protein Com